MEGTPEVGSHAVAEQFREVREAVQGVTATPGEAGGVALLNSEGHVGDEQLPPTGTSLLVAASNADDRIKARADYVCDGTADEEQINDALVAGSIFGARVDLSDGWFSIDSPVLVTLDNMSLIGVGKGQPLGSTPTKGGSLILRSANFVGEAGVIVRPASEERVLYGVTCRDFSIDGLSIGTAADGIIWRAARSTCRNVWISRWTGNGVASSSHTFAVYPKAAHDNLIENVRIDTCGGHGMSLSNGSTDNLIRNCIVTSCTGNAVNMTQGSTPCTANMLIGNYLYSNTGKAVVGPLYQTQLIGNRIQDCNGGIYLDNTTSGAGGFQIVGNIVRNASIAADNTTDGINIACTAGTARGGLILGNSFHTDPGDQNGSLHRMRFGINIAAAGVREVVVGQQSSGFREASSCFGTGVLSDSGTGTTVSMSDRTTLRGEGETPIQLNAYGSGAIPVQFLRAARGTILNPLRSKSGDTLGRWGATGASAATDEAAASLGTNPRAVIDAIATEDHTATGQGASLIFKSTLTGSLTTAERFRLNGGEGIDFNQGTFGTYMMRLKNNAVVMGRNNAGAANVSLFKVNTSDQFELMSDTLIADGKNLVLATGTGTKIGTAAAQKLAVYGATPVIQASAIGSPAAESAALKTAVDAIRVAIKNFGITA